MYFMAVLKKYVVLLLSALTSNVLCRDDARNKTKMKTDNNE